MHAPDDEQFSKLSRKETLEIEELELKIKDLRRPFWVSSSLITSLLIASLTAATAYFAGYFQLQQDKADVQTKKQEILKDQTSLDIQLLDEKRKAIVDDTAAKQKEIKDLISQRDALEGRNQRLAKEYERATAARLNLRYDDFVAGGDSTGEPNYAIYMYNSGKSPVKVLPLDIYVDGKFRRSVSSPQHWYPILDELGINFSGILTDTSDADPRALWTLNPGDRKNILSIEKSARIYSNARRLQFAGTRIGIMACFCTARGICSFTVLGTIPISERSCHTKVDAKKDIPW
jgi:hypothetical protein